MDIINVIVNFWYVNIEVHIENVQKSFKVTHISIYQFEKFKLLLLLIYLTYIILILINYFTYLFMD